MNRSVPSTRPAARSPVRTRAVRGPLRSEAAVGARTVLASTARLGVCLCALTLGACASPAPRVSAPDRPTVAGALPDDGLGRRAASAAPARAGGGADGDAPTLYDELGGREGVAALSERLIREIAADDRIRGHYRDTDIGRFHRMMQLQMCERTGGGCTYTGDDMRRTHGGMNITPTEFNAIVEAMMRAMDARGLPVATQNRLLAIYAPMREDIIDR